MGKTSLDEGVGLEVDPTYLQKISILQNVRSFERSFESSSHSSGALPLKALAATAPNSRDSSFCTSTESYPYETLDEGIIPPPTPLQDNNELTQSLPSCNNR